VRERERARARERGGEQKHVCVERGFEKRGDERTRKRDGERGMARTICREQTFAWRVGEGGVGFHERAQGLETRESEKVREVRERETASERKKESVCICV